MSSVDDGGAWWRPDGSGPEILDITLGDLLDAQAARHADRPAILVDEAGSSASWTYAALKADADLVARGLMASGVKRGDRVAVMAPNCGEWVLLEYALAKIGAVLVTVNPALLKGELDYLLGQSRASTLIFAPRFRSNDIAAHLTGLMPDLSGTATGTRQGDVLPDLRQLIAIGADTPPFALPFDALRTKAAAIPEEALADRQSEVRSDDVVMIQYTSGTTGKPKGAMLTHRSTINNARLSADRAGFAGDEVLLSAMPFFHTAGCVCNVMTMLACGGLLVAMDAFDPLRMLQLWDTHKPTVINAVPTMLTRVIELPQAADHDLRTLRNLLTGGTNIPPSLMRLMHEKTGGAPMIIMGMTETSPLITQTNPADDFETRITTAGTPLPHTEIRITDPETGRTCGWDQSGELCIRGYLVMKGYFDMPDRTAETIDAEGWLHSGDLAELSATGHLRIVGRLKDMIIRGGENVYPVEIEDCLLEHPAVSQVQVVGVPDPDLGEEICAYVVPLAGAALDPQELQSFCRARLARHKLPKYIAALDELPLTANGKVQKFALRDTAAKAIADGHLHPVPR